MKYIIIISRYIGFVLVSIITILLIFTFFNSIFFWSFFRLMDLHFYRSIQELERYIDHGNDVFIFLLLFLFLTTAYYFRAKIKITIEKIVVFLIYFCPNKKFSLYFISIVTILIGFSTINEIWTYITWGFENIHYIINSAFTLLTLGFIWLFSLISFERLRTIKAESNSITMNTKEFELENTDSKHRIVTTANELPNPEIDNEVMKTASKGLIGKITNEKKTIKVFLFSWTFLNLIILVFHQLYGQKTPDQYNFYPFCEHEDFKDLFTYYDLGEFIVYTGVPWFIYFLNFSKKQIIYGVSILFLMFFIFQGYKLFEDHRIKVNYEKQRELQKIQDTENARLNEERKKQKVEEDKKTELLNNLNCTDEEALRNFKNDFKFNHPDFRMVNTPQIMYEGDCMFKISLLVQDISNPYLYGANEKLVLRININADGNYQKYSIYYINSPW